MAFPKLLVFDLDGTLIDSRQDLVACVNATLRHHHLQPLQPSTVSGFIGDGAAALVERSLAAAGAPAEVDHAVALTYFLDYYREHLLDHTHVYPGVLEALAQLRNAAEPPLMAVLTNKPVHPSQRICDALGLSAFLFANRGGNSFATKKPDPEGLLALWKEAENLLGATLHAREVILIGDSEVDVRTARNAGVRSLGCTWGFAREQMLAENPDLLAHTPRDWLKYLQPTDETRHSDRSLTAS